MPTDRRNALAALAAAGLIWGLTVPMSKVAMGWLDPLWLTVARFGAAAPVLALASRGASLRAALTWRVAGWGALFYGMVVGVQNIGVGMTSVSHGALICGAVPAFVAVVALASGRGSAGPVAWTGFAVAIVGVALVAGGGGASSSGGDLLVLLACAISAVYVVAQPSVLNGRDPAAVTAVQMAAGALVATPFALAFEGLPPGGAPTLHQATAFLALAGLGSVVPFVLYAYGQKRVTAEVAGAFVNLEPLVGATIGASAFGDPFGPTQLIGAAAIVGGILMSVNVRLAARGSRLAERPQEQTVEGGRSAPAF